MSKKRIKPNETDISERKQIIRSFCTQLEYTALLETDINDHKCQVETVYKQMLHEKKVIDECRRRFKRTFEESNFKIYRID